MGRVPVGIILTGMTLMAAACAPRAGQLEGAGWTSDK